MRTVVLSGILLAFVASVSGCGGPNNAPLNQVGTIKASQYVDKKGKTQKIVEADVPDSGGKK